MPSSSGYDFKPGGSLKFKGGEGAKSHKKKRSKTKSSSSQVMKSGENKHQKLTNQKNKESSDAPAPLTEAQRKFDEVQKRRMAERIKSQASLSHKDKVDKFNKSLADRTEHNDMLTVAGH